MRDKLPAVACVSPVPGTTLFLERPYGLILKLVIVTWDDICPRFMGWIGERQRRAMLELQRRGYGIGGLWPIFNYPDYDHLIVYMVRFAPGDCVHEVLVSPDGSTGVKGEFTRLLPPPISGGPLGPESHVPTPEERRYVAGFPGEQDALACVHFAAAVNGGPPAWITRHLAPDVVAEVEGQYTYCGSDQVAVPLSLEIDRKLGPPPGFCVCAELGRFPDDGAPGVALLVFQRGRRRWKPTARRSVWRFLTQGTPHIQRVEALSTPPALASLRLAGLRPALQGSLPRERGWRDRHG